MMNRIINAQYLLIICKKIIRLALLLIWLFVFKAQAQEQEVDKWDNQLFLGNKFSAGMGSWRFSGELQVRLKDNTQALDRWFLETIASYMPSEHWEIAPEYRFTIKSDHVEHRVSFGAIWKHEFGKGETKKSQLSNQVKWQGDMNKDFFNNGLRYVLYYNYTLNQRIIPNAAGGLLYRWSEAFTGVQYIRFAGGFAIMLDEKHSLNLTYWLGMANDGNLWTYQGMPFIQLIFHLNKNYKYVPAKFISF